MTALLEHRSLTPYSSHAEDGRASWLLSGVNTSFIHIRYRPAHPSGKTWIEVFKEGGPSEEEDFDGWWAHRNYVHEAEIAGVSTHEHARAFVEHLRSCTEDRLADEVLLEAGFVEDYPDWRKDGRAHFSRPAKKSGRISVCVHNIGDPRYSTMMVRYDPANSRFSHPILFVEKALMNHQNTHLLRNIFPEACRDPIASGCRFLVDVLVPWVEATRMNLLKPCFVPGHVQ